MKIGILNTPDRKLGMEKKSGKCWSSVGFESLVFPAVRYCPLLVTFGTPGLQHLLLFSSSL